MVLEKTFESPLDCKEIQPVHPKGDQSWVFIGRTDVEAEAPILWLLDMMGEPGLDLSHDYAKLVDNLAALWAGDLVKISLLLLWRRS